MKKTDIESEATEATQSLKEQFLEWLDAEVARAKEYWEEELERQKPAEVKRVEKELRRLEAMEAEGETTLANLSLAQDVVDSATADLYGMREKLVEVLCAQQRPGYGSEPSDVWSERKPGAGFPCLFVEPRGVRVPDGDAVDLSIGRLDKPKENLRRRAVVHQHDRLVGQADDLLSQIPFLLDAVEETKREGERCLEQHQQE